MFISKPVEINYKNNEKQDKCNNTFSSFLVPYRYFVLPHQLFISFHLNKGTVKGNARDFGEGVAFCRFLRAG